MTQPATNPSQPLEYAPRQARTRFSGSMVLTTGVPLWLLVFALVFIVPQFKNIFRAYHLTLPGPTLMLILLSDWVIGWGWVILVLLPLAFGFLLARVQLRPRTAVPIASISVTLLVIVFAYFLVTPLVHFMRDFSSNSLN